MTMTTTTTTAATLFSSPVTKVLQGDEGGGGAEPSDNHFHTAKSLFVIEPAYTRAIKTTILWDKPRSEYMST